jgi:hypothetical protein
MIYLFAWIRENKGRFASLIIALFYIAPPLLAAVFRGADPTNLLPIILFLILPLSCIWFSDALGGWTGFSRAGGPRITQTSPGCLVAFVGWILLLLPIIAAIFTTLSE